MYIHSMGCPRVVMIYHSTLLVCVGLFTLTLACPNGWTTFEGHCYNFVTTKQTWFHAAQHCLDDESELVSVENVAESQFLKKTIQHLHSHENPQQVGYWTAGNDLGVEGRWMWGYPGKTTMTYTDWFPGEPNNIWYDKREEDCVVMWGHDSHNYQWNDQPCDILDYYVCEMEDGTTEIIG